MVRLHARRHHRRAFLFFKFLDKKSPTKRKAGQRWIEIYVSLARAMPFSRCFGGGSQILLYITFSSCKSLFYLRKKLLLGAVVLKHRVGGGYKTFEIIFRGVGVGKFCLLV